MFQKATFDLCTLKEQRCILRQMQGKKAVILYDTYVDMDRCRRRCRRRTSRALAPFYELDYRKNLFNRIKAIGKPAPGYDATIDDSIVLTEDDEEEEEEPDLSLNTVINTGKTGTQKSNDNAEAEAEELNLSDNDCSSDVMTENAAIDERSSSQQTPRSRTRASTIYKSKRTYTITQNYQVHQIDSSDNGLVASECNVSSTAYEYNVEMSEDIVASSTKDTESEPTQSHAGDGYLLEMQTDDIAFATPLVNRFGRTEDADQDEDEDGDGNEDEDEDDDMVNNMDDRMSESSVDSLNFLTQDMDGRTSTQSQRIPAMA